MSGVFPPTLDELIAALRCLPGVGPKSAQRAAFHLLQRDRPGAERLSKALAACTTEVGSCPRCRMLAETGTLCQICADPRREDRTLVVVESPADVAALEQATGYRGRYFVLMGRLSPLDGMGPTQLGGPLLEQRLSGSIEEVIVATGTTMEGEATAHWIGQLASRYGVRVTRIAYGVPVGGELEYVDGSTLARAFSGRQALGLE